MGSRFFVSRELKHDLEKDLKKRTQIEDKVETLQEQLKIQNEQIKKDLTSFLDQVDEVTVFAIFEYMEQHGTIKQQEILIEIEERYINSSLLIEDTLNLIDWYEKMCDFHKNFDLED